MHVLLHIEPRQNRRVDGKQRSLTRALSHSRSLAQTTRKETEFIQCPCIQPENVVFSPREIFRFTEMAPRPHSRGCSAGSDESTTSKTKLCRLSRIQNSVNRFRKRNSPRRRVAAMKRAVANEMTTVGVQSLLNALESGKFWTGLMIRRNFHQHFHKTLPNLSCYISISIFSNCVQPSSTGACRTKG